MSKPAVAKTTPDPYGSPPFNPKELIHKSGFSLNPNADWNSRWPHGKQAQTKFRDELCKYLVAALNGDQERSILLSFYEVAKLTPMPQLQLVFDAVSSGIYQQCKWTADPDLRTPLSQLHSFPLQPEFFYHSAFIDDGPLPKMELHIRLLPLLSALDRAVDGVAVLSRIDCQPEARRGPQSYPVKPGMWIPMLSSVTCAQATNQRAPIVSADVKFSSMPVNNFVDTQRIDQASSLPGDESERQNEENKMPMGGLQHTPKTLMEEINHKFLSCALINESNANLWIGIDDKSTRAIGFSFDPERNEPSAEELQSAMYSSLDRTIFPPLPPRSLTLTLYELTGSKVRDWCANYDDLRCRICTNPKEERAAIDAHKWLHSLQGIGTARFSRSHENTAEWMVFSTTTQLMDLLNENESERSLWTVPSEELVDRLRDTDRSRSVLHVRIDIPSDSPSFYYSQATSKLKVPIWIADSKQIGDMDAMALWLRLRSPSSISLDFRVMLQSALFHHVWVSVPPTGNQGATGADALVSVESALYRCNQTLSSTSFVFDQQVDRPQSINTRKGRLWIVAFNEQSLRCIETCIQEDNKLDSETPPTHAVCFLIPLKRLAIPFPSGDYSQPDLSLRGKIAMEAHRFQQLSNCQVVEILLQPFPSVLPRVVDANQEMRAHINLATSSGALGNPSSSSSTAVLQDHVQLERVGTQAMCSDASRIQADVIKWLRLGRKYGPPAWEFIQSGAIVCTKQSENVSKAVSAAFEQLADNIACRKGPSAPVTIIRLSKSMQSCGATTVLRSAAWMQSQAGVVVLNFKSAGSADALAFEQATDLELSREVAITVGSRILLVCDEDVTDDLLRVAHFAMLNVTSRRKMLGVILVVNCVAATEIAMSNFQRRHPNSIPLSPLLDIDHDVSRLVVALTALFSANQAVCQALQEAQRQAHWIKRQVAVIAVEHEDVRQVALASAFVAAFASTDRRYRCLPFTQLSASTSAKISRCTAFRDALFDYERSWIEGGEREIAVRCVHPFFARLFLQEAHHISFHMTNGAASLRDSPMISGWNAVIGTLVRFMDNEHLPELLQDLIFFRPPGYSFSRLVSFLLQCRIFSSGSADTKTLGSHGQEMELSNERFSLIVMKLFGNPTAQSSNAPATQFLQGQSVQVRILFSRICRELAWYPSHQIALPLYLEKALTYAESAQKACHDDEQIMLASHNMAHVHGLRQTNRFNNQLSAEERKNVRILASNGFRKAYELAHRMGTIGTAKRIQDCIRLALRYCVKVQADNDTEAPDNIDLYWRKIADEELVESHPAVGIRGWWHNESMDDIALLS